MVRIQKLRASALIITLLLIVLITILVVGFLTTSRMEVVMSRSHLEGVKAGFIADTGVNVAMAKLEGAIGSTNSGFPWSSSPGRLSVSGTNIDLSSGTNASAAPEDVVDLNRPGLEDASKFAIAGAKFFSNTNTSMRVQWKYVDRDGLIGANHSTNSEGRFAFWVDDESAKVNLNTAWKRGNTNTVSHPSQVSLQALGFTNADGILQRPFNTVKDARRASLPGTNVEPNVFQLSTYSHTPELSMFNQPRIVLTTQKNLAGGSAEFIDILLAENTDPGLIANLDPAKVTAQVNRIAALLNRTDWPLPGLAGKSFGQKYNVAGVHQIALNIIEYVRSAESPTALVEPVRGNVDNGSFTYSTDPFSGPDLNVSKGITGNARGPRIVEFGIFVSPQPVSLTPAPYFLVKVKMKVFLPTGFGLGQLDLSKVKGGCVVVFNVTHHGSTFMTTANSTFVAATPPTPYPLSPPATPLYLSGWGLESGSLIMNPGESRTLVASGYIDSTNRNSIMVKSARLVLNSAAGTRIELVPTRNIGVSYSIDADTVSESNMTTRSVDDPSVNKNYEKDWSVQKANTFQTTNATTLGSVAAILPKQDTDSSGRVTDLGLRFPAPKGEASNPFGMIQSVADLGFVHTGLQTLNLTQPSVPWRSLRLQPQSSSTELPDWAILDLFQAPRSGGESYYVRPPTVSKTASLNSGGKVNLNFEVLPFQDDLKRPLPLEAVFHQASNGTANLTDVEARALVLSISRKVLAAGGSFYGLDRYITSGQICEIEGIADSGEVSEALVRNTLDLLTPRSGVFSIYSVGQSIRVTSDGTIQVLGERRKRSVVERFESATGEIGFRSIFSETLNP